MTTKQAIKKIGSAKKRIEELNAEIETLTKFLAVEGIIINLPKGNVGYEERNKRNLEFYKKHKAGIAIADIAKEAGMSYGRVLSLIHRVEFYHKLARGEKPF
jgi:hypothetical protein